MLKDLSLKAVYRSEDDNLVKDFYLPALDHSISYDRAVGFFSASMLSIAAQGIVSLLENGGTMRLIFGGELAEDEVEAIKNGYDLRRFTSKYLNNIVENFDQIKSSLIHDRLAALSWMVANGKLDIKVALKRNGMYHEKIGIFTDVNNDKVIFQGSANETTYGLLPDFNFESITVFKSWVPEFKDHYQPFIDGFERLWTNNSPKTLVLPFPEAAIQKLIEVTKTTPRPKKNKPEWPGNDDSPIPDYSFITPHIPQSYKGRPFAIQEHQREALNAWKARAFNGILSMATGSGKTVTSIYAATTLFNSTGKLFLLIAVPYQTLAEQWIDELKIFNIDAIPCFESQENWYADLLKRSILYGEGVINFCACVVVNKTMTSDKFQSIIQTIPKDNFLFIGDECHNHGAENLNKYLPRNAGLRIGLSATAVHYRDIERTQRLRNYYGEIVYEYSLEQALSNNVLTPYDYHVHFVELDEYEATEFIDLSNKLSKLVASGVSLDDQEKNASLDILLFKRARILGNARNKLRELEMVLSNKLPSPYHLFYCGDGSVTTDADDNISSDSDYSYDVRQLDLVTRLLAANNWKVSQFTSRESSSARKFALDQFKSASVHALAAIRCLDEGVDVPDCREAHILASSRNPRQFIQRRGRILRKSFGKDKSIIHDYIALIPTECEASKVERNLLKAELERVSEFARFSLNRSETYEIMKPLLDKYDLAHYFI